MRTTPRTGEITEQGTKERTPVGNERKASGAKINDKNDAKYTGSRRSLEAVVEPVRLAFGKFIDRSRKRS